MFSKLDSAHSGQVNREAINSYLESEERVKLMTSEDEDEEDRSAYFERLGLLSGTLSASQASKVSFNEFATCFEITALRCIFDELTATSMGMVQRTELLTSLQEAASLWDPHILGGVATPDSVTVFQRRCRHIEEHLEAESSLAVTWEAVLGLYEKAALMDLFSLCTGAGHDHPTGSATPEDVHRQELVVRHSVSWVIDLMCYVCTGNPHPEP